MKNIFSHFESKYSKTVSKIKKKGKAEQGQIQVPNKSVPFCSFWTGITLNREQIYSPQNIGFYMSPVKFVANCPNNMIYIQFPSYFKIPR